MMSGPPLECSEISSRQVETEPSHGLSMEEARCFGGRLSLDQSEQTPRIFSFFARSRPDFRPRGPARASESFLLPANLNGDWIPIVRVSHH